MTAHYDAMLSAFSKDRALASSVLFSHRHTHESPPMHVEMMDLWRCADEFVLIEAFREGGKSTLAEEFLLLEGAFGNFYYCLLFGETYDKACQRLEAVAHEAANNTRLHNVFGGRVLAKRKPVENKIWFESGAFLQAVGWEQEVTGFKHLDRRPDRAYFDDIENLERVRSAEAVDATMRKIYREVLPAMDKVRRKIRFTQTPRAADCSVTRLRNNPEWVCRSFPICMGDPLDPRTESNWPDRYPMDWIRKERRVYESAGMLREFEQEYMLSVEGTETKPFTESMIRSVDIAPAAWLPRYAIYDPARTAMVNRSDRTGKVVVSRMGSKIIVHESRGEYWKPDEMRSDVFKTNDDHSPAGIGIEKNALDDYLLQPIRFEMLRRGVSLPIEPLQAPQDRDKAAFIMGLHPFFAGGDIILVGGRGMHPQLVAEMLNFPGGRLDVLNALAYSLRMFAGAPVYEDFGEDNIANAPPLRPQETVYACWNASPAETVCAAVLRDGRHYSVLADWSQQGPILDATRAISTDLHARFAKQALQHWCPAELHDQWQRVSLVPALRELHLSPWRAEHIALARGCLAESIRLTIRQRRCLAVDKTAKGTINALAGAYRYGLQGGRTAAEPQAGQAKLLAEAIETLTAMLGKGMVAADPKGAHWGTTPGGQKYMTSMPKGR